MFSLADLDRSKTVCSMIRRGFSSNEQAIRGEERSSNDCRTIFGASFPESQGFLLETFGGCENSTKHTSRRKNLHHWCKKSPGVTTLSFWNVAQGTERATAFARRDREIAGGCAMKPTRESNEGAAFGLDWNFTRADVAATVQQPCQETPQ